jgi:transcriptional regulator with XRE-family HTH domain
VKYYRQEKALVQLGKKIKNIRTKQGISQSQLAFEVGISREQIGRIEMGKINTSVSNIIGIASALDVSPKDLFDF